MTTMAMGVTLDQLDANPYPVYARLRREHPLSQLPELGQWLVTRWQDVQDVLRDRETYTTDVPESPMIRLCGGPPMLLREDDDHQDIREAFIHDYDPHRVTDYVDTILRPAAERVADAALSNPQVELTQAYFEPIGAEAEAILLGIGQSGAATLLRWARALVGAAANFRQDPEINALAQAVLADDAMVRAAIARLRTQPDWSVISHLLHANRPAGDSRTDADLLPVLKHVAMAVIEPGWLAGWTLLALLDQPEALAEVRDNRGLLGAAVYEGLRWSGPVGTLTRRTTRPVTLAGQDLPADAMLIVAIASANRDESVFPNPDTFDLHRDVRTHLGFGAGPHSCPAFPFVTAIARTALDVLLDRLTDIRPVPGWEPAPHGWKLRLPGPIVIAGNG